MPDSAHRYQWWQPLLLVAAVAAVYGNSLGGAFVLDDLPNIVDNAALQRVWPPWQSVWGPQSSLGTAGRPLFGLSLAANWALGGDRPWGYHVVNLVVHALAAMVLLGVVRRTLISDRLSASWADRAAHLAFAVALLWAVHPLTTQAVTYTYQRAESMMGLLFLLTLYCAIRGWQGSRKAGWHALAVAACLVGVGCKEVIVAAPPLVLLWEVVFEGRGVGEAVRRSRWLYFGLGVCLALLFAMIAGGATLRSVPRAQTPNWLPYVLTQGQVIVHYIGLALWPARLVLDYGWRVAEPAAAAPAAAAVGGLVVLTAIGLWRRNPLGYLGAWFFGILSVTSLVPLPDLAFEHRMYLPLAAVVALAVAAAASGGRSALGRLAPGAERRVGAVAGVTALAVATCALGARTWHRNREYHDPLVLWSQTVVVRPDNPRALNNLGNELRRRGRIREGVAAYRRAIAAEPEHALAHRNLGFALAELGDIEGAIREHRRALELDPRDAGWYNDLALLLRSVGLPEEAVPLYEEAVRRRSDGAETAPLHFNLGVALEDLGRTDEAIAAYRRALELDPGHRPSRRRIEALVGHTTAP